MTSSYRAVVERVIPVWARDSLKNYSTCYVGISLGNLNFERPRLDAVLGWARAHFHECAVLIGDSIHRLTLQITEGLAEQASLNKALETGEGFVESNRDLLTPTSQSSIHIVRFSEISETADYKRYFAEITALYEGDREFAYSVRKSAEAFVYRQRRANKLVASAKPARELSVRYLLEEMSGFAYLVAAGWAVEVYPGAELPALAEIAEGKYTLAPAPLKVRVNVELGLRRSTT